MGDQKVEQSARGGTSSGLRGLRGSAKKEVEQNPKRRGGEKEDGEKKRETAEKKRARQKTGFAGGLKARPFEKTINPRFVEIGSRLIGESEPELTAPDQIMSLVSTLYWIISRFPTTPCLRV